MEELRTLLKESLNGELRRMTAGGPRRKDGDEKIRIRPVVIRDRLVFQIERFRGNQAFHQNLEAAEAEEEILRAMENFRQLDVETSSFQAVALVSKKGRVTVKRKGAKMRPAAKQQASVQTDEGKPSLLREAGRPGSSPAALLSPQRLEELSHNRKKHYILEEGRTVPFLVDLGVQTPDGRIVKGKMDKFRQINRFLEFIQDIMPILPKERSVRIIDFGCGKSYLTFAMYHYLHELCGLSVRVTGLDLKEEVIRRCNALALKYGYEGLEFLHGDIADYTGADEVDMVVTLHACDTATDYALYKAVSWKARVILSVPCCQHEVNRQIDSEVLKPALKYGLIRERMSALLTDAVRANLLEEAGYETQILEFIDMEHTPKNILIRAVKKAPAVKEGAGAEKGAGTEKGVGREREAVAEERPSRSRKATGVWEMTDFLHVHTCLQRLMEQNAQAQPAGHADAGSGR